MPNIPKAICLSITQQAIMAAAPKARRGTGSEAPLSASTVPGAAASSSAAGGDEHAPVAYDPTVDDGEVGVISVLKEHDEIAEGHGLEQKDRPLGASRRSCGSCCLRSCILAKKFGM